MWRDLLSRLCDGVAGNAGFYYLCSVPDGYSRCVHWEIRESMTEADAETILSRAHELFPEARPRVISDNGPQFVARDFDLHPPAWDDLCQDVALLPPKQRQDRELAQDAQAGVRWFGTPLNLEDARRIVAQYVRHYTNVGLHAGIGYVMPRERLDGRDQAIWEEGCRKLVEARLARRAARQPQVSVINTPGQRSAAALALAQQHEALVERLLPKQDVVGSNPITRSLLCLGRATSHAAWRARAPFRRPGSSGLGSSRAPLEPPGNAYRVNSLSVSSSATQRPTMTSSSQEAATSTSQPVAHLWYNGVCAPAGACRAHRKRGIITISQPTRLEGAPSPWL